MKKTLRLLVVLVACLSQEAEAISVRMKAGLGGFCGLGTPAPLGLSISGLSEDFEGKLTWRVKSQGNSPHSVLVKQDLFIAKGDKREWLQHFQVGNFGFETIFTGEVILEPGNRKKPIRQAVSASCQGGTGNLVTVLGFRPDPLIFLKTLTFYGMSKPPFEPGMDLGEVEPWALKSGISLGGTRLLVVDSRTVSELREEQAESLTEFVERGGKLLIFPGQAGLFSGGSLGQKLGIGAGSGLEGYALPKEIDLGTCKSANQGTLGKLTSEWPTEWDELKPLIYDGAVPILGYQARGLGRVYWMGMDPRRAEVLGSGRVEPIFRYLLSAPANPQFLKDLYLATADQIFTAPSISRARPWTGWYLLIFVLLVGPGHFLLLKKSGLQSMAWVTFSLVIGLTGFTGLVYTLIWPGEKPKAFSSFVVVQEKGRSFGLESSVIINPDRKPLPLTGYAGEDTFPINLTDPGLKQTWTWQNGRMVLQPILGIQALGKVRQVNRNFVRVDIEEFSELELLVRVHNLSEQDITKVITSLPKGVNRSLFQSTWTKNPILPGQSKEFTLPRLLLEGAWGMTSTSASQTNVPLPQALPGGGVNELWVSVTFKGLPSDFLNKGAFEISGSTQVLTRHEFPRHLEKPHFLAARVGLKSFVATVKNIEEGQKPYLLSYPPITPLGVGQNPLPIGDQGQMMTTNSNTGPPWVPIFLYPGKTKESLKFLCHQPSHQGKLEVMIYNPLTDQETFACHANGDVPSAGTYSFQNSVGGTCGDSDLPPPKVNHTSGAGKWPQDVPSEPFFFQEENVMLLRAVTPVDFSYIELVSQ